MTKHRLYSAEGVELVRCHVCHNETLMAKAGKFGEDWYCNPCYLRKIEQKIDEWKYDYRMARNNREWDEVKHNLPLFTTYMN